MGRAETVTSGIDKESCENLAARLNSQVPEPTKLHLPIYYNYLGNKLMRTWHKAVNYWRPSEY